MTTDGPRLIRAAYTSQTITVYQAYAPEIADPWDQLTEVPEPGSRP